MENCIQYQPPTTEIPIDVNEKFNEYQPSDIKIPFDVNNKFHVFLSFRGADVRKTLVDHLYESLSGAGLRVFLDSEELEKGKDIDSSLQTAIDTSDILIPIFSKNYAESTWCLKEAARMCRSNGFIIPLFYDVKPCDVRYPQRCEGLFAEAFQKHYNHLDRQDKNTIEEWKNALHQISSRSGWTRADELESGGLGRLMQKKFNIYIGYHTADAEEALMGYMHKYPRTGSLGICMGSEDEQSREAIDSSDILVPVLSKRFAESNMCQSKFVTMVSSDGLFIPLSLPSFTDSYKNLLFNTC